MRDFAILRVFKRESYGKTIFGILRVERVFEQILLRKTCFRGTVINSSIRYLLELQDLIVLWGSELADCCFGDAIEIVEQVQYKTVGLESLVEQIIFVLQLEFPCDWSTRIAGGKQQRGSTTPKKPKKMIQNFHIFSTYVSEKTIVWFTCMILRLKILF